MLIRPDPILALNREGGSRLLAWIVGLTTMSAMLALVGALALGGLTQRWTTGLTNTLTVEIDPAAGTIASPAVTVARVVALLRALPAVTAVTPIDEATTRQLLRPWLGDGAMADTLPLPALVSVTVARASDSAAIAGALAAVPEAQLDDHAAWLGDLLALAQLARILAGATIVIVGGIAITAVVLTTRSGLAAHRLTIELLHLIGATDRQIAGQFQHHVAVLALRGSLAGVITGGLLIAGLTLLTPLHSLSITLSPTGVIATTLAGIVVLVLATTLAALTTRWTVLRALRRLP
ncbi:MAG: hypothetical protein P4M00_22605 [Azospirillaceae bacterium]|nr:hypothetical protein [Azospirillaceae bacterium]